jgi:cytoplasmic tRNA 2-thiolation protein 2
MDQFKVNYTPDAEVETILIAVSLGQSSLALLDMVIDIIRVQKQQHRGRQGFYLRALVIDDSQVLGPMTRDVATTVDSLKHQYPECEFTCYNFEALVDLFPPEHVNIDGLGEISESPAKFFDLLPSLPRTSQQDLVGILRRQVILGYAQKHNLRTVVWGSNMTRLAEIVLSLTAKGRGQDIPLLVDSEVKSTGNIDNIYPIRDVLMSEIVLYNDLQKISSLVVEPIAKIPVTTKLQSIDELVHQYFGSIEENFPSIVSTVVRTADKLGQKPVDSQTHCRLCGSIVAADSQQWLKNITVSSLSEETENANRSTVLPNSVELCYGCLVTFKNSNVTTITWPRASVHEVLNEYSLE